MAAASLALRKLTQDDIPLLTKWLHQDYILEWYHSAEEWLTEINGRHGTYAWITHMIVMLGEISIGFCQYYDCFDAGDMEDWYHVAGKGDTYSIDYLIGEPPYLGKGYGKQIVRLLTEKVYEDTSAKQIIVQPDADNHASNHVLLANGYRYDEPRQYYAKLLRNAY